MPLGCHAQSAAGTVSVLWACTLCQSTAPKPSALEVQEPAMRSDHSHEVEREGGMFPYQPVHGCLKRVLPTARGHLARS